MTIYTKNAVDVFAPTTAGGVPRAVSNADAQIWGTEIQAVVSAALAGVGEVLGTWDASSGTFPGSGTADTGDAWIVTTAGTTGGVAFRVGDRIVSITTNSSTSTYAGNWLRLAANLDPVVSATDSGAGTANAIQVVASKVVSASGGQLVAFQVFEANTGTTVTLQITDAAGAVISGLAVKTASGADPAVGALSAGLSILGQIEDTTFRILSDLGAAADRAAVEAIAASFGDLEAAREDWEAARDKAEAWAETPEDEEVETGQFSALHHAAKANADRVLAETAQGLASDALVEIETLTTYFYAALASGNFYVDTTLAAAKAAAEGALSINDVYVATAPDVDYVGLYVIETGPVSTELWRTPNAAAVNAALSLIIDIQDADGVGAATYAITDSHPGSRTYTKLIAKRRVGSGEADIHVTVGGIAATSTITVGDTLVSQTGLSIEAADGDEVAIIVESADATVKYIAIELRG